MSKSICVFCSSSSAVDGVYADAARELGRLIAGKNYTLVYGGADVGVMGELARAVHAGGGRVVGVIPELIRDRGLLYERADEVIVTADLRERKRRMEELSDAYIVLPGGFGTIEETLEALTLKQLGCHAKPVVFINTADFYNPLFSFFESLYGLRFAKEDFRKLYHVSSDAIGAMEYIETYRPAPLQGKWF